MIARGEGEVGGKDPKGLVYAGGPRKSDGDDDDGSEVMEEEKGVSDGESRFRLYIPKVQHARSK